MKSNSGDNPFLLVIQVAWLQAIENQLPLQTTRKQLVPGTAQLTEELSWLIRFLYSRFSW